MTNEEAIEILQEEHDWVQEPYYVIKAIEMAISALRMAVAKNETTTQPAHIDREAWGCPLCNTSKVISFEAWEDESKFPKGPSVRGGALFCPHCGKPRNEEAWAELEKRVRGAKNG